jgi:hypothetical protein
VEIRSAGKPFYQRGSFWFGRFTWGLGLLLAVGLGIGWYVLGGFPRDHDRYGEVPVPGIAALSLPAGDVRLNFENHATRSGDVSSAGTYLVSASAEGQPAPLPPKLAKAASPPPSVDEGAAISVGQSPWTPGDSKLLGGILCGVVVLALTLAFTLPFRHFVRDE